MFLTLHVALLLKSLFIIKCVLYNAGIDEINKQLRTAAVDICKVSYLML